MKIKSKFVAGALALALSVQVLPAQAHNDASAVSALSLLPIASVVAVGSAG